jgi:uncharacterized membrane protein YkvA (DUF1232 family)
MITICLLILIGAMLKKPVGRLGNKLKNVDWKGLAHGIRNKILAYSRKVGRAGSRVVLTFYYAMQDGDLTPTEKAMVYAGLVYIVVPRDLLPRKVLNWVGVLDDMGVAAWIIDRISKNITPEIERKVDRTLDNWFGPVVIIG